jgi:putative ABC transport system permease protein
MSVLERTREIGMLRALGMANGSIIRLFFIETGLIGFFGALAGLLLFLPLNAWMVGTGIDYSAMMAESGITNLGYRVMGVFKSAWNFPVMFGSVAAATLLSAVTALFPSRRAVRMTITEAMRMD